MDDPSFNEVTMWFESLVCRLLLAGAIISTMTRSNVTTAQDHVANFREAAKQRCQGVPSARVTWRQTVLHTAAGRPGPAITGAPRDPNARDITIEQDLLLIFDQKRVLGSIRSTKNPQIEERCSSDGAVITRLTRASKPPHIGVIEAAGPDAFTPFGQSVFLPVLRTFLSCEGYPGIHGLDFKDHDKSDVIDGANCMVLEAVVQGKFTGPSTHSIWVAPEHDYIVLRYASQQGDHVNSRMDISYAKDTDRGWLPNGWRIQSFTGAGAISQETTARDVKFEFAPVLTDADFAVVFPPETHVTDKRTKKRYTVPKNDL
jgi:hypothetical protein